MLYFIYLDIRNWSNWSTYYVKQIWKGIFWTWNLCLNCYCKWTVYSIRSCLFIVIISIWFMFLIRNLLDCRYFDPFTIQSPDKNKQNFHYRHIASYLVYGSEGIVRALQGDRNQFYIPYTVTLPFNTHPPPAAVSISWSKAYRAR